MNNNHYFLIWTNRFSSKRVRYNSRSVNLLSYVISSFLLKIVNMHHHVVCFNLIKFLRNKKFILKLSEILMFNNNVEVCLQQQKCHAKLSLTLDARY